MSLNTCVLLATLLLIGVGAPACLDGSNLDGNDAGSGGDGDSTTTGDGDGDSGDGDSGDGDGSSSGDATAGVSNDTQVGSLTQAETTALCMHFDSIFDGGDEVNGCCVSNGVYQADAGQGVCEDIVADCKADPASYECEPAVDTDPDNCETDPPPECTGEVTVGEVATCIGELVAAQQAVFDSLDCDTTLAEFDALGNQGPMMPASCDIVMESCPDLLGGGDSSQP